MDQEKIGKFIAEIRKTKGLTQQELAKKLNISNRTISNWENGKSLPDYNLLIPLAQHLDISITELINGKREEKNQEPNKVIEKVITFLKHIELEKKKKYKIVGLIIALIGILFNIITIIFVKSYVYYGNYYMLLGYIITLIGFAYIYQREKVKKMFLKTIQWGIITSLLFVCIDIIEINVRNTPPRYATEVGNYYLLLYYQTPLYDVYSCRDNLSDHDHIREYTIIPKKFNLDFSDLKYEEYEYLERKYCKTKNIN